MTSQIFNFLKLKWNFLSFLFLVTCIFSSCGPKVIKDLNRTYSPLSYTEKIMVFKENEVPKQAFEVLGEIALRDTGFTTKCSYSDILNRAKKEALLAGGNGIKIKRLIRPDFLSNCFRLEAQILKIN